MTLPTRRIGDLDVSAVGLGCMPLSFEDMVDNRERALGDGPSRPRPGHHAARHGQHLRTDVGCRRPQRGPRRRGAPHLHRHRGPRGSAGHHQGRPHPRSGRVVGSRLESAGPACRLRGEPRRARGRHHRAVPAPSPRSRLHVPRPDGGAAGAGRRRPGASARAVERESRRARGGARRARRSCATAASCPCRTSGRRATAAMPTCCPDAPTSASPSCRGHRSAGRRRRARSARTTPSSPPSATSWAPAPQETVLAWLLATTPVMIPIPGATRPATIDSIVRSLSIVLSDDQRARLDGTQAEMESMYPDDLARSPLG